MGLSRVRSPKTGKDTAAMGMRSWVAFSVESWQGMSDSVKG